MRQEQQRTRRHEAGNAQGSQGVQGARGHTDNSGLRSERRFQQEQRSQRAGRGRLRRVPQGTGTNAMFSLKGFIRSFGYAFSGIGQTFLTQRNMRVHVVFALAALVACAVLRCTPVEWAIVIVLIGVVMSAEMINTAVESTIDLVTSESHPLAKRAKDVAAAAVLVLAIVAVVAGLVIYVTAFMRLMGA